MNRVNSVQRNNDKRVEKVLKEHLVREEIIKEDAKNKEKVVGYHFGKKSSSEPYAWRLLTGENIDYIRQVDYTTKFARYDIRFYFGLDTETSRNWINKIKDNREIITILNALIAEEGKYRWTVNLKYCVYDGGRFHLLPELNDNLPSASGKDAVAGIKKILETDYIKRTGECYADKIMENGMLAGDIKQLLIDIYGEDKTGEVQSAVTRYFAEKSISPEDFAKKMEKYNEQKSINDEIKKRYLEKYGNKGKAEDYKHFDSRYKGMKTPKSYPAVIIRWALDISCVLNEKPVITEEDFKAAFESENNLAKIYREQTNKIFDIFGSEFKAIQPEK